MSYTTPQTPNPLSDAERASMLRVNHAGEYGARRIYQGQLAALRASSEDKARIRHMAEQEEVHLKKFEALLVEHRVRPSLLLPLWHVGGFAMGALTAALGRESAYACTVAVEAVIDTHYAEQEERLHSTNETELLQTIGKFRAEEQEHHDTSIGQGALNAPAFPLLNGIVRGITKSAIALAKHL